MSKVFVVGFPLKENKKIISFFRSVDVDTLSLPNIESAIAKIPDDPPTVVLADRPSRVEEIQGLHEVIQKSAPATPFLIVLPEAKIDLALPALRAGAFDCLSYPLERPQVLAAAKRAAIKNGRTLFIPKIQPKPRRTGIVIAALSSFIITASGLGLMNRAVPAPSLDLSSATLSGVQWHGKNLWVGNWFDSSVTLYEIGKSAFGKSHRLITRDVFKLPDIHPVLLAETEKEVATIGFDLKLRMHKKEEGLPVSRTENLPASNPTGLAWYKEALWSCDGSTELIYEYSPDLKVTRTIKSIVPEPVALVAWKGLWVVGGQPLKVARLSIKKNGAVWHGPYRADGLITEGVIPSGVAIGHRRIWAISGGNPIMTSIPLNRFFKRVPDLWEGRRGARVAG